jgi:hypothetical protein
MSDRMREAQEQLAAMREARNERDDALRLFAEADIAIKSVTENAGPVWKERALDAVRSAARVNHTITSFDARMRCDECETYDGRAWGGVMREAARRGWIVSTGKYRPGPVSAHGRPLLQWRSRICEYMGSHWAYEEGTGASNAE